jgi:hypothetical protein
MAIATQLGSVGIPQRFQDLNRDAFTSDPEAIRMAREGNANRIATANIGNLGVRNQQERFNQVFPWLKDQITGLQGQLTSTVGGQSGQGPPINAGPVVNPNQMQQQINAMRARSGMLQQTQAATNAREAAARGVGANSPLRNSISGLV